MELAAQRVHLVEQVDHGLDRLVVEAHLIREIGKKPGARHVDRLEDPVLAIGRGPQQAARDPALDMDDSETVMCLQQFLERGHVNCSIAWRGS
jgi:hypothetical protein